MAKDPARWREAAEFLGGMLTAEQARELACDLIVTRSQNGWPILVDRIVGNHVPGDDATLNALDVAIHHKEGMLERFPRALFASVYHYFRDGSDDAALIDCAEVLRVVSANHGSKSIPSSQRPDGLCQACMSIERKYSSSRSAIKTGLSRLIAPGG